MQWQGICRTEYIQMRLKGMWCLILLFLNQPHIWEVPCWLCIWSSLILSMWARDSTQAMRKKWILHFILFVNWSTQSVCHFYLSNISEGKIVYICIYTYMFIAYMHVYVCIHINIYNPDCINANFACRWCKRRDRHLSVSCHTTLIVVRVLKSVELILYEDSDTILSYQ